MPGSPALAEGLAEPVLRLYLEAEAILLRSIARRLARGITDPGWAIAKLLEVDQLRAEVEAQIGGLTSEGRAAIEEAVRTAYGKGLDAGPGRDERKRGWKPCQLEPVFICRR